MTAAFAPAFGEPRDAPTLQSFGSSARLSLPSSAALRWPLGKIVADYLARRLKLPDRRRDDIAMAVHEAVLNAVIHGNLAISNAPGCGFMVRDALSETIAVRLGDPVARDKTCALGLRWNDSCIFIRISDEGAGFTPVIPDDLALPVGRGLRIIAGLAASCKWVRGGRTLLLRFDR
jgi:hypothetical protein